jgi:uncharacterized repeat protein (TIGR03803 family)
MTRLSSWKILFAISAFCVVAAISSSAQTFTSLVKFGHAPSADEPRTLIQGFDGNFYGETRLGVASGQCQSYYCGTIFRMTPRGEVTTLYSFCTQANCPDGQFPNTLLQAADGNFYGTTLLGGAGGEGTLFRITPAGRFTTLHSFCACLAGANPTGLMQAADGDLYGTTYDAGIGYGTIFKMTTDGRFTTFYTLSVSDGSFPTAGLVQGRDGNFYGTTSSTGGLSCFEDSEACGTVFRLTSGGSLTTIHKFCNLSTACTDGAQPGQLILGTDGSLYGTTIGGGNLDCDFNISLLGCGTLFKVTLASGFSTLYTFCSSSDIDCADGAYPQALVQGTDGNIYGTASNGGDVSNQNCTNGCGTTFEITAAGTLTTLHTFEFFDGAKPDPLIQSTNGTFYGATVGGGGSGSFGTIYSLSTGLAPFVETNPAAGKAGAKIVISGSDLTGTTTVTFNGTPAQFEVVGKTVVIAKVPNGATSGLVKVTALGGTLTSSKPFVVIP